MEYDVWAPRYARIQAEFGYPFDREEAAAAVLGRLLRPADRAEPLERLGARIRGRDAIVVG
ncbi:MAG: hypothetical protein WAK40_01005, partial [Thermoplasmata archaeon]